MVRYYLRSVNQLFCDFCSLSNAQLTPQSECNCIPKQQPLCHDPCTAQRDKKLDSSKLCEFCIYRVFLTGTPLKVSVSQRFLQDFPKIFLRFLQDVPKFSPRSGLVWFPQDFLKVSPRFPQDSPKIWSGHHEN